MISTEYDISSVKSCKIVPLDDGNVSDHLPIRMCMNLNIKHQFKDSSSVIDSNSQMFTNWNRCVNNANYMSILRGYLCETPMLNSNNMINNEHSNIQNDVDKYTDVLRNIFIKAARDADIVPKKMFTPKKYWCPELSKARDTKRFWWRLWTANGRPKDGQVYNCYTNVKRLYRKLSRQCIYARNNELYGSLNELFRRDKNRFWRSIKKSKKSYRHESMNVDNFVCHFSKIMQETSQLSPDQQAMADIVKNMYGKHYDTTIPHVITSNTIEKCLRKLKHHSSEEVKTP